jgi:stringent starvation protein B
LWYNRFVAESEDPLARLQSLMTELLKHRISESLDRVESALGQWRAEEIGEFEAHAEVLRHAARTEKLAARMARVSFDQAGSYLRDAFDFEVIDREEFRKLMGCEPEEVEPSPGLEDVGEDASELPEKRDVAQELLTEGAILVHVDAREEEVGVPERFAGDSKLVLRFGHNLTPSIPDLEVDEDGIRGTLTFSGVPYKCDLPWDAVYAVVSEIDARGLVWPDDVPDDVVSELANTAGLTSGENAGAPGPDDDPNSPGGGKRSAHLRLVK